MKVNKLIISLLLILTIFSIVGVVSASDSSNETTNIDESYNNNLVSVDNSQTQITESIKPTETKSSLDENDKLKDEKPTLYVAPNEDKKYGDGSIDKPFASIDRAVKNATIDGTTIFIKNGEYKDSVDFTDNKISLRLIGEEKGKVLIRPTSSYVKHILQTCTTGGTDLVFENLSFLGLDYTATESAPLIITGDNNVNLTNCSFTNINAKYAAMQIKSSKEVNIFDCVIENCEVSDGKGSVIEISGSGHYNINRLSINNVSMEEVFWDDNYMTAVIYISNSNAQVIINNTNITNAYKLMDSLIQNRGNTVITNTIIANNIVNISGTHGHKLIYNNNNGILNISNSLFINNVLESSEGALFEESSKAKNLNIEYCAIYNNTNTKLFEGLNEKVSVDNNYWGTNTKPSELNSTINSWIVKDDDEYKVSDGETLSDLPSNIAIPVFNETVPETNISKNETEVVINNTTNSSENKTNPKEETKEERRNGTDTQTQPAANQDTVKSTSTTPKQVIVAKNLKVKKSAKTLKIKVSLKKVNNKILKNKKVTLKFKDKKYSAKTNKNGVVTFKISKKVLKKLKKGKTYKYTVTYGKYKLTRKISVRK